MYNYIQDKSYNENCKECVAIHRAHMEHVSNCMRPLVNNKLRMLLELTEHTIANEIEPTKTDFKKRVNHNFIISS